MVLSGGGWRKGTLWYSVFIPLLNTLAARGLEEHVRITLIFSRIISFMLLLCCFGLCTIF